MNPSSVPALAAERHCKALYLQVMADEFDHKIIENKLFKSGGANALKVCMYVCVSAYIRRSILVWNGNCFMNSRLVLRVCAMHYQHHCRSAGTRG